MEGPVRRFGGLMFQDASAESIQEAIESSYRHPLGPRSLPTVAADGPRRIVGLVAPHAGYVWSGAGAAHCYHRLASDGTPDLLVVIGLSHRGLPSATQSAGAWETPLGLMPIDADAGAKVAAAVPELRDGPQAHGTEHSLEVHLPFLQHIYGDRVPFVPIMIGDQGLAASQLIGQAVSEACAGRSAVIIASTDMSHYEPKSVAERQDRMLIEYILRLDEEGLWRARREHDVTMCGYGAVVALLVAAKALGATSAELLSYYTSGDVGSMPEVVGYASIAVTR